MNSLLDRLNLTPQEQRLVVGTAIVIFVGLNIWLVMPHFGDLGRNQQRIRDKRKQLSDYQREVNQKPVYEKELSQLKGLGLYIPSEEVAGQLLREVQNQAGLSKVALTDFDASPRRSSFKTNSFFDEQTLLVRLGSTGERELIDFLFRLSSRESLTRVRTMKISPDSPQRHKLAGNITFVKSFQRKPTTRSTVSTPSGTQTPTNSGSLNSVPASPATNASMAEVQSPLPSATTPPPTPTRPSIPPSRGTPLPSREPPKRIAPKPAAPK